MPTLGQATTGLLALTAILVLTRSLSTMAGYNTRGLWLDSALTSAPQSSQAEVLARTRRVAAAARHATSSPPPPPPPADACLDMRQLHGVVPHVTWGSLPEAEQVRRSPHCTPHTWHPPPTTSTCYQLRTAHLWCPAHARPALPGDMDGTGLRPAARATAAQDPNWGRAPGKD